MSSRRSAAAPAPSETSMGTAIGNALLVAAAMAWGLASLVQKGRLSWPPYALLSSLATLAGCLALVGPIILLRTLPRQGSLGELCWLTVGLLVWMFNALALLGGRWKSIHWATPLSHQELGLTVLAVLLAGWKCGLAQRSWSWTNVAGWMLSVFWITMAACSWLVASPARTALAGP